MDAEYSKLVVSIVNDALGLIDAKIAEGWTREDFLLAFKKTLGETNDTSRMPQEEVNQWIKRL